MALKRLSIVAETSGLFSHMVINILIGSSGGPVFSVSREVRLLGRIARRLGGIRVMNFGNLLTRCYRRRNISTVIGKLETMASFRCRFRVTLAGGGLGPGLRALFLATRTSSVCLDSDVIHRVTAVNNSVDGFIPTYVRSEVIRELGGGWTFSFLVGNKLGRACGR